MTKDSKGVNHNNIFMAQEVVHFDTAAFDMLLRANGVVMEHYRAIKCPLGIDDRFDVRAHNEHDNCSNGFIYKSAGDVTVFFSGNSSNSRLEDFGIMDGSTTQVTIPRFYDGTEEQVIVQHYDRFFLKEVAAASVNTQLVEAHVTGTDRLQYRATKVEAVIDANGTEYGPGDYEVRDGRIVWSERRPPFDAKLGRGIVYSIRYHYIPFWYVKNIIHEVRVSRTFNMKTQRAEVVRLPFAIQLQREYAFENEERTKNQSDARDVKSPRSGSFGPR